MRIRLRAPAPLMLVYWTPSLPWYPPALSYAILTINAFLPSDQEVRSLFGDSVDLIEAANTFCEWGVPLVVIKIGADGVLVRDREHDCPIHLRPYHSPGDARVIDVTGAGDAFCGGFMVGLAGMADPIHAAQMGLVSASLIIEGYGALYALQVNKEKADHRLRIVERRKRMS